MNEILIDIDLVLPNPWQPRESEDAEHVKALALSIAQDGLLQKPLGRLMMGPVPADLEEALRGNSIEMLIRGGARVQLAFGHSRLAAFRWLRDVKDHSDIQGDFSRIPVLVREISDEEMFRLAVTENIQRRELNPLEEARAMLRYREEFGKTSTEIGQLFGIGESAVRNKIRLANLPKIAQQALASGVMREGAARELLRLYDLPQELQGKARNAGDYWRSFSIEDEAMRGRPADFIHEEINKVIERHGNNLHEAKWKWEEAFDRTMDEDIQSETCKACSLKVEIEKKTYCTVSKCFGAKRDIWIKRRLALASAACGIPAPEDIHNVGDIEVSAEVRTSGCANLRVIYDPERENFHGPRQEGRVAGFKDCRIVCGNRNSICTCEKGLQARKAAESRADAAPKPAEPAAQGPEPEKREESVKQVAPAGPTAEELRLAAREERKREAEDRDRLVKLRAEFARRVGEAVLEQNRFAWHALMIGSFELKHDRDKIKSIEETAYLAALDLAEKKTQFWDRVILPERLKELNKILALMGLPEIVSMETPVEVET